MAILKWGGCNGTTTNFEVRNHLSLGVDPQKNVGWFSCHPRCVLRGSLVYRVGFSSGSHSWPSGCSDVYQWMSFPGAPKGCLQVAALLHYPLPISLAAVARTRAQSRAGLLVSIWPAGDGRGEYEGDPSSSGNSVSGTLPSELWQLTGLELSLNVAQNEPI